MAGKWFHCTSRRAANSILRKGFYTGRISVQYADYYGRFLDKMLTRAEVNKILDVGIDGGDEAEARERAKVWNAKFSGGTLIWLTKRPDSQYGEVCFEVCLPRNAKPLGGNRDMGWVFYVPTPIPSRHFVEIEVVEE